ncbi:hypothetical protein BJ742DRAFT_476751 [Cladochytrium replicatum]|nr:hypothetical protein BJ742DRAFT_476751 [Cladochytrium replicatum]
MESPHRLAYRAIAAKFCKGVGFSSCSEAALERFSDVVGAALEHVFEAIASSAEHCGRRQVNLNDLRVAMSNIELETHELFETAQCFAGVPQTLKMTNHSEPENADEVHRFRFTLFPFEGPIEAPPPQIPPWFPPFPTRHTYRWTPVAKAGKEDGRAAREQKADELMQMEWNLRDFLGKKEIQDVVGLPLNYEHGSALKFGDSSASRSVTESY